jgi:hypothetical protein
MTKLQSGHDCVYLQNVSVTLTFDVGAWFLDPTNCLGVVDIYAKLFSNPSMHDKFIVWTQMCVSISSYYDNVKLQNVCQCDL